MGSSDGEARPAAGLESKMQNGIDLGKDRIGSPPRRTDYVIDEAAFPDNSMDNTMSKALLKVTIDRVGYCSKPMGAEFGALTNRLKLAGPTTCTPSTFCGHVKAGKSWVGATYVSDGAGWGRFIGQQLFGVDFDNVNGQHEQLAPDDDGFIDPVEALDRCYTYGIDPMCLYFTKSASCPDRVRFRIVFDMGRLLDERTARKVLRKLLALFPEADQACANPNRVFLGSNGEVWGPLDERTTSRRS